MVKVELPFRPGVRPTNPGFRKVASPLGITVTVTFKVTLVVRPRLRTVTVEEVELPAMILEGERPLAEIVKSGVTVIV